MLVAFEAAERLAASDVPVLIRGESGTGKELLARSIHRRSRRARATFEVATCAAVSDRLLERELFGREKGTSPGALRPLRGRFELASEGSVFLDEVGAVSFSGQGKLLRILEKRPIRRLGADTPVFVRARLLAATNQDLSAAVEGGRFREDLYARLGANVVDVPPLRERGNDVSLLADYFLGLYGSEYHRPGLRFAVETRQLLLSYPWPGNVRQLRHAIERAVLLADRGTILPADLFPGITNSSPGLVGR